MRKLNVAGDFSCGVFTRAKTALAGLATIHPERFTVDVKEFPSKEEYNAWLTDFKKNFSSPRAASHTASPIVWLDGSEYLGGMDDTLEWCKQALLPASEVDLSAKPAWVSDGVTEGHGFDYDLVVIGGGSGGLACSKEACAFGAKVACLDFVKPSPVGSKWGLGGTCVNVGCIPKKLMHNAALLGEHAKDAAGYGWSAGGAGEHAWETLRQNVQDHIKGLNFGYRVQLREKGVTYLNKLGKFVGPNTLECTDKNGKVQTITSARFVVAVGGRPTPLSCPGGEHAITSDDLFMKGTPPGKTCVVGAGYVALECAGFINGIHPGDVTVLVRSIPLRGFDRESVDHIVDNMVKAGVNIVQGVLPSKIEKMASGKLQVTFGDKVQEFDTVLCAIGRSPDLKGLGITDAFPDISVDNKSGKLVCINERTSVPHIYAIGDVIHAAPELTPVAIQAGALLSRRLFGSKSAVMDYKDIATTIFTPLEFGTIGLTEEEATEKYGSDNVDCYLSKFAPLEWTITEHREGQMAFFKLVIHKAGDQRILGMHVACPNAGEVIQGFAVAFKKNLTYKDLMDTVGIHPTVAEEFTTMNVLKSSGCSTEKSGC